MLVYFSFQDILRIPEVAAIANNQIDLLDKKMDNVIAPMLWLLGADIDKGVRIQATRHRTLGLKEVVGYRYACLERQDKDWLKNTNCSMSARIEAQEDKELASDMVRMSVEGMGESGFRAMCVANYGKEGTTRTTKKEYNETEEDDLVLIRVLQGIQRDVRGELHQDEDIFIGSEIKLI